MKRTKTFAWFAIASASRAHAAAAGALSTTCHQQHRGGPAVDAHEPAQCCTYATHLQIETFQEQQQAVEWTTLAAAV